MPTTESSLFPPPTRAAAVDPKGFIGVPFRQWLFSLQRRDLLALVDTAGGPYNQTAPPAGLNATTGQSNQNQRITYFKTSADANVFTLNGIFLGPLTLKAQGDSLTIQSDGTLWYQVATPPAVAVALLLETNGAANGSQTKLNLHSSDGSVTLTDDGVGDVDLKAAAGASPATNLPLVDAGAGAVGTSLKYAREDHVHPASSAPSPAIISATGQGAIFGPGIDNALLIGNLTGVGSVTDVANTVYLWQFVLNQKITISRASWQLAAGTVGAVFSFGIYDAAGNLLLQASFTRNFGQNTYTAALGAVTLPPGVYWFAQTASTNDVTGIGSGQNNGTLRFLVNDYQPHYATAAHGAIAGVLPATLGVISGTANTNIAIATPMWEPN